MMNHTRDSAAAVLLSLSFTVYTVACHLHVMAHKLDLSEVIQIQIWFAQFFLRENLLLQCNKFLLQRATASLQTKKF